MRERHPVAISFPERLVFAPGCRFRTVKGPALRLSLKVEYLTGSISLSLLQKAKNGNHKQSQNGFEKRC
jgi:hypothetical protein